MSVLLLGFDTESEYAAHASNSLKSGVRKKWLVESLSAVEAISRILKKHRAPATFFLLGCLLDIAGREYQNLLRDNEMFNVESHTYSHLRIKPPNAISLTKLQEEIKQTKKLIKEYFHTDSIGLRAPGNFFKGLQGYPDILKVIWDNGIRFLGSDGQGPSDKPMPASFAQPYWYKAEGFPYLLELPITGWHDTFLLGRVLLPWSKQVGFPDGQILDALPRTVDEQISVYRREFQFAIDHDMIYSPGLHPWSIYRFDPKLGFLRFLLEMAEREKVPVSNFKKYYEKKLSRDYEEKQKNIGSA